VVATIAEFSLSSATNSRDLVFLKLSKTDLSLQEAYWVDLQSDNDDLVIHSVLQEGDYYLMSGYTS